MKKEIKDPCAKMVIEMLTEKLTKEEQLKIITKTNNLTEGVI